MLRIVVAVCIVTISGCSMQDTQHYNCDWQGTGILSKYSVIASARTKHDVIETFQITATSDTINDRLGGTCAFDLSEFPTSQIDRTMPGRLRIVNSRGEGRFYIDAAATKQSVMIGPIGKGCSTGGMPRSVTLHASNGKCEVEWYGR